MSKKLLIIVLGAVVVLGGGATAAFFLTRPPAEEQQVEAEPEIEGPAGLVDMETFLVNINDPEGERYAKLQLGLSVVPAKQAATISEDLLVQAKMRDRVLTLLTAQTFEELSTPLGKEALRREIKARLDPLIEEGEVQEVLFQDFVVQ